MTTGIDVFDTTIQKTNVWLKDLMEELGWDDKRRALSALRSVLHSLRDRLTIEEATDFGAQLPMLIRGFYYEGWDPSGKPMKMRHKQEFFDLVQDQLINETPEDVERIVRAVFQVVQRRIDEGEIEDIIAMLPADLQDLWD